jgi:alpha/beta superfamily hydrolase
MADIFFNGPEGRIEARFHRAEDPTAPIAIILHPHPLYGGTMNNKVVYSLYHRFLENGFSVLRFNFRGVGKSLGKYDNGVGELADAAAALDWVQLQAPDARSCWICGFSFGAWIALQLMMRRPEIQGFVAVSPPANMYDFSFLAPCPASGIFVQGAADTVVQPIAVQKLVDKLRTQKHITIHHEEIPRANHFFENEIEELMGSVDNYLDFRLSPDCPIK